MSIKLADSYEKIPDYILLTLNQANPFFLKSVAEYYDSIGKKVYYFYDDERIMPIVVNKKLCFRYGYLLTEPWHYTGKEEITSEQEFLDAVMNECKKGTITLDWIGQTPPSALFTAAPTSSVSIPFGSHVIDLSISEEDLWANVHSKHRNVIRKAEKTGVVVYKGGKELLPEYLVAEKDTMERSNMFAGSEATYSGMFEEFKDHVIIFMAKHEGTVQGGAIILYNQAMGYYMHGASINSPVTGAMNLVQWEIIKYLKAIGVKKYSFVGCRINEDEDSKYHGIQNFKKRFGGELLEGKMFKVINNPIKYSMYMKMIKIKTRGLVTNDIIDQEIHKWQ